MEMKHSGEPNIFKSGQYENDYFLPGTSFLLSF